MRGKWVEVDQERLARTLERFEAIERRAANEGLSFSEAMRLLAGADIAGDGTADATTVDWSETVAGPWLAETLAGLRHPDGLARIDPGKSLQGTLRPYQQAGVQWLYLLIRLKLGACLADDMGLGKTIQVVSTLRQCSMVSVPGSTKSPRFSSNCAVSTKPNCSQMPDRNFRLKKQYRRQRRCLTIVTSPACSGWRWSRP